MSVLLEARPYRPFKSSEEYLEAMREDLAEWLNIMYPELLINADNFMDRLDTGVALCKHANNVRKAAEEYLARRQARNKSMTRSMTPGLAGPILAMGNVHFLPSAKSGTFFARDNVSNFITWCRKSLKIFECLLFETDDLIMRKNEKHVILCLLEVARRGAKFGMLAPMLVQMERQIDREIAADNKANGVGCGTQTDICNGTNSIATETEMFDTDTEDEDDNGPVLVYGPQPQIITNDLKSLDEMVRDLVEKCTCPSQFPMVRVSEGKYRIGDTKVLIFVRILRSHVMVRVGGGWDTLSHYLDKHDPCRCKAQHRSSVAARLVPRTNSQTNGIELHKAQVIYERSPPPARKTTSSGNNSSPLNGANGSPVASNSNQLTPTNTLNTLSPPSRARSRSRSPTPQKRLTGVSGGGYNGDNSTSHEKHQHFQHQQLHQQQSLPRRVIFDARSRRALDDFSDLRKKQTSLDSPLCTPHKNNLPPVSSDTELPNGVGGGPNQNTSGGQFDSVNLTNYVKSDSTTGSGTLVVENANKFENISDNGSEISDEGYRSLGIIQPTINGTGQMGNAQKRESLHSQASIDDAELNGAQLDQTSSDSQISPSEENSSNRTPENLDSNSSDQLDSTGTSVTPSPQQTQDEYTVSEPVNNFEQSGVFITDNEITVDIASVTGLRKTGFSDDLYGDDALPVSAKKSTSKIPLSPLPTRRRSVDDSSDCGSDFSQRTGLPLMNRKQSVYRSVRQRSVERKELQIPHTTAAAAKKSATNTWSGRATGAKKRSSITNDTFSSPTSTTTTTPATNGLSRNTPSRSSQVMYDSNGRRIRGSTSSLTTSPVKNSTPVTASTSPLAQQILEAAGNAKNDAQILEKMKQLLTKYSSGSGSPSGKSAKKSEYDDFTTAWVHSNGKLDRASSCSPPTKAPSKRSSAASSTESTHSKDMSTIMSPRRDRGPSRIPAPIRNNTELY